MTSLAIVGLGSWGLCVFERAVVAARSTNRPVTLHLIEPGPVGGTQYAVNQPDYLVLNNPCGQLSLAAAASAGDLHGLGLYAWAVAEGYTWHGSECRRGGGRPIEPTDFLPRRLMGEYLHWFYDAVLAGAPGNVNVIRYRTAAVDIVATPGGREHVRLADGGEIVADHVVLTSGHTPNRQTTGGDLPWCDPYPLDRLQRATPAGAPVAIAGMGLVAYDVLAGLTTGRGGTFEERGARLHYRPSGHEPAVSLYSRHGVPCCAKPAHGIDPTGSYRPVVCTPEAFAALRGPGGRRPVDFHADLLPLLYAEMKARFHTQFARVVGGEREAERVAGLLRTGWQGGRFHEVVAGMAVHHGAFDPAEHLFAGGDHFTSSGDYQAAVVDMVDTDLDHALTEEGSPVKAAQEVLRILRDQLRSVIEFGGLSGDSYVRFQTDVRGRINRMEAGPPAFRSQQLLALIDAGVVRVPHGPAPVASRGDHGGIELRSTAFDRVHREEVAALVRGHLELPTLARTASPLLRRLHNDGRLNEMHYGDSPVGSVALSEDYHPIDVRGKVQPTLTVLGVLTEGVRYFTHYLPSPQSRIRAVLDAQACVEAVLSPV